MATLTLYENYAFSSSYDEVMDCRKGADNRSPHDEYLATLNNISLGIPSMYATMSGSITVQWDGGAFGDSQKYNYMQLHQTEIDQRFFAFIRNIRLVNDLALITYVVDDWSTWSPRMVIRDSLRSATRFPLAGRMSGLPIPYISNAAPAFDNPAGTTDVKAIIVYQYYKLSTTEAPSSFRSGGSALMSWRFGENGEFINSGTYGQVAAIAAGLVAKQSVENIAIPGMLGDTYYEITAIYIVPSQFEVDKLVSPEVNDFATINNINVYNINSTATVRLNNFNMELQSPVKVWVTDVKPGEVDIIGVGVYTHMIPITHTGMWHYIEITMLPDLYDVNMQLTVDGTVYSWENNFELPLPYTSAHADVTQQAKLSRQIERANYISQETSGAVGLVGGVGNVIGGIVSGNISKAIGGVGGIATAAANMYAAQETFSLNGSPRKLWTGATKCDTKCRLNATLGMGTFSTGPVINQSEVNEAIAEVGYNVAYLQSSLDVKELTNEEKTNYKYDVVRFTTVRITGAGLSEDVKSSLRNILLNGCKLWYVPPT